MSASSQDRAAIITGASKGIGRGAALVLAERGYDVAVTYRSDPDGAAAVAEEVGQLGRNCEVVQLDLEEPAAAEEAVRDLRDALGRLDVLVNNAAFDYRRPLFEDDVADWERALRVNLLGPVVASRAAAQIMIADGVHGSIVNVSSVVDRQPVVGGGAYASSKAALAMATEVMALEFAEHGIRVNAVAPGFTTGPSNFGPQEIDPRGGSYPEIPVGRPASAREIALGIAYLASDEASYVTGTRLLIDGGMVLRNGVNSFEGSVADEIPPSPDS
jgi:NAD(P)-dependent dehydrogenase (short-subunit alcohol dehydrogenase family)